MKTNYMLLGLILSVGLTSCDDESNPGPTLPDIENNYTVSTLTTAFDGSGGAAVDTEGNIYVADFGDFINNANGKIVTKVTPDGTLSIFADTLNGPSGNAFDTQGNLIQANIRGNFVAKISPDGSWTELSSSNLLRSPVGVAIDADDNAYVCNCGGASIAKITPDGTTSIFVQSNLLTCPNGITFDDEGNLYPVNFNNGAVLKITPDGTISQFATIPGGSNAHITFANNRFYVVARSANRIYEVSKEGEVTLIAGAGPAGNNDGTSAEATFFIPNGIAASPDGKKLYVVSRVVGTGPPLNPVLVRVIDLNE